MVRGLRSFLAVPRGAVLATLVDVLAVMVGAVALVVVGATVGTSDGGIMELDFLLISLSMLGYSMLLLLLLLLLEGVYAPMGVDVAEELVEERGGVVARVGLLRAVLNEDDANEGDEEDEDDDEDEDSDEVDASLCE